MRVTETSRTCATLLASAFQWRGPQWMCHTGALVVVDLMNGSACVASRKCQIFNHQFNSNCLPCATVPIVVAEACAHLC